MAERIREILVTRQDKRLQIKHDHLHVKPGDLVHWTSTDGDITIEWKTEDCPFEPLRTTRGARRDSKTPDEVIRHLQADEKPSKQFFYKVTHVDLHDVITIVDPDIIIDEL
jgi:cytidylate kinase